MPALREKVAVLAGVAAVAMWLLLAGPPRWLGVDSGHLGTILLMGVMWLSLHAISRLPRDELDAAASPAEWRAWLGLGFMLLAVVYAQAKVPVFAQMSAWNDPQARAVARNLVMLLIAWAVLSGVVGSRWKGAVTQDERDRQIEKTAAEWGRGTLVFCVAAIAVTLGVSPAEKLQWARPLAVAHLLVFALMWGWLFEHAAAVVLYWRSRH